MFCGKDANHKINSTHKRALRILHNYYDSSPDKLLKKSDTVAIHIKNLNKLMLESYKSMNHLNPSNIWHLHERKETQYDLKTKHLCNLPITNTINLAWSRSHSEEAYCGTVLTMK